MDDLKTAVPLQNCWDKELDSSTSAVQCPLSRVPVWFTVAIRLNFLCNDTSSTVIGTEKFQYITLFWYLWWSFHDDLQNFLVAGPNKSHLDQQMLVGRSHKNYKEKKRVNFG